MKKLFSLILTEFLELLVCKLVAQSVFEWCGTPPLIRPIGTTGSVKYGILLDDIKIMVSSSCIVVDSIRSCFMTLIMQSKDSFLIHGQQQIPFKECSFK